MFKFKLKAGPGKEMKANDGEWAVRIVQEKGKDVVHLLRAVYDRQSRCVLTSVISFLKFTSNKDEQLLQKVSDRTPFEPSRVVYNSLRGRLGTFAAIKYLPTNDIDIVELLAEDGPPLIKICP